MIPSQNQPTFEQKLDTALNDLKSLILSVRQEDVALVEQNEEIKAEKERLKAERDHYRNLWIAAAQSNEKELAKVREDIEKHIADNSKHLHRLTAESQQVSLKHRQDNQKKKLEKVLTFIEQYLVEQVQGNVQVDTRVDLAVISAKSRVAPSTIREWVKKDRDKCINYTEVAPLMNTYNWLNNGAKFSNTQ